MLKLLGFDSDTVPQCVLYLLLIGVVVHSIAYFCLVSKAQKFARLETAGAGQARRVTSTSEGRSDAAPTRTAPTDVSTV